MATRWRGCFAIVCALSCVACNPNDAGGSGASAAFFDGPGSEWTAQLNPDGASIFLHFAMLGDTTADELVNATRMSAASGFGVLAVISSAGMRAPSAGALGWDVDVPDSLLVLGGFADAAALMVPARACPGSLVAANVIKTKAAAGWSPATGDASGVLSYDPGSGVATFTSRYGLDAPATTLGALPLGAGPCADGVATADLGSEMYFALNGTALVHTQPSAESTNADEIYLALPQAAEAITLASVAGDYIGTMFDESSGESTPVSATLQASPEGVGGGVHAVDVQSGGVGSTLALIGLDALGPNAGLASGNVIVPNGAGVGATQPLTCAMGPGTPQLIACVGAGGSGALVSFVLAGP
jgi:hypothetical protein